MTSKRYYYQLTIDVTIFCPNLVYKQQLLPRGQWPLVSIAKMRWLRWNWWRIPSWRKTRRLWRSKQIQSLLLRRKRRRIHPSPVGSAKIENKLILTCVNLYTSYNGEKLTHTEIFRWMQERVNSSEFFLPKAFWPEFIISIL